ncbi:MAG: hypothetical protein DRI44_09365 [Chlamydiae bacterium]|nr:MAG: hypothetical protein DRI44_09365 [Chlamydiota bacterium]
MKKLILLMAITALCFVCNNVSAYTQEIDPVTPLPSGYIGYGEWNTDGDFENWTYNDHISNAVVTGGNFDALSVGNDAVMNLNASVLSDSRKGNVTKAGTIIEIRAKFIVGTANTRIDLFPTINGVFKVPPIQISSSIVADGAFHVYRVTLDGSDTEFLGVLNAIRLDPVSDVVATEAFQIDYLRIANMDLNPVSIDPMTSLMAPTTLGDWPTDGDFDGYNVVNITNETVSGGIFSGEPLNADPWFYKLTYDGLPEVDLDSNPYIEFRMKQAAALNSGIEVFFTLTNNPGGLSGDMRVAFDAGDLPQDGQFHVYRYRMSANAYWTGVLGGIRIDPYTVDTSERFEIDYIQVGNIPEPALLLGIILAGIAIFRKRF